MRLRGPAILGVGIGLAAGLLVLGYGSMHRKTPGSPMLGDQGGPIREVVMQYAHGSDFVAPVFRQYLGYQGPGRISGKAMSPSPFSEESPGLSRRAL